MRIPIPALKVLLYGPGLQPAGLRARVHFECNNLVVKARGVGLAVPARQINLKTGGYDSRQWLISWVANEGTYSALLQGEEALEAFIQLAPAEISQQLEQARKTQARRGCRFSLLVALLALLLPLLALVLFWANADRISRWAVSNL